MTASTSPMASYTLPLTYCHLLHLQSILDFCFLISIDVMKLVEQMNEEELYCATEDKNTNRQPWMIFLQECLAKYQY